MHSLQDLTLPFSHLSIQETPLMVGVYYLVAGNIDFSR